MSEADAVAAVLWLGATLYAIFGGADFGAGFWDLLAGRRGARGAPAGADGPSRSRRCGRPTTCG